LRPGDSQVIAYPCSSHETTIAAAAAAAAVAGTDHARPVFRRNTRPSQSTAGGQVWVRELYSSDHFPVGGFVPTRLAPDEGRWAGVLHC
jgi:hypothetical protein